MCCFLKVTATKTLLLLSVFVFSNAHTVFLRGKVLKYFLVPQPLPPPPLHPQGQTLHHQYYYNPFSPPSIRGHSRVTVFANRSLTLT